MFLCSYVKSEMYAIERCIHMCVICILDLIDMMRNEK